MNAASQSRGKFRLLIVDDHGLTREGLLALFRVHGVADAAASGLDEAVWVLKHFKPAVVLVGITSRGREAIKTARSIIASSSPPRLVFLDDAVRPAHVCAAVAAGGSGYWTKHASFDQLAEGIRRVAAGELSFCPAARWCVDSTLAKVHPPHLPPDETRLSSLTHRESQVLVLLAEGLSVKQCAQRLKLSPRTIDNHRVRMMKKLGIHKIAGLVRLAVHEGLVDG